MATPAPDSPPHRNGSSTAARPNLGKNEGPSDVIYALGFTPRGCCLYKRPAAAAASSERTGHRSYEVLHTRCTRCGGAHWLLQCKRMRHHLPFSLPACESKVWLRHPAVWKPLQDERLQLPAQRRL
ncbi:uncharacterized protein LOC124622694 [Schistocerca americana]|uniref:uncharacterized protein LOC124622694 n=1 Tax=Schistocerca americana TaxID=7009 RepID=UPI001F4F7DD2|nr:uncharacterized protein LOC124622694 [Schistocerca americana]